jgi:hypothetical protein
MLRKKKNLNNVVAPNVLAKLLRFSQPLHLVLVIYPSMIQPKLS